MFQCVDKPTICNTFYEWSLLSINWLYIFRTITSPSSGASSHKLYKALQASVAVAWMYIHAIATLAWQHEHTNSLYSLWDDAPDDGLVIVRNMYSQIMDNKDHSWELLHLVGLSTHWNIMHGTYNVKFLSNSLILIWVWRNRLTGVDYSVSIGYEPYGWLYSRYGQEYFPCHSYVVTGDGSHPAFYPMLVGGYFCRRNVKSVNIWIWPLKFTSCRCCLRNNRSTANFYVKELRVSSLEPHHIDSLSITKLNYEGESNENLKFVIKKSKFRAITL